MKDEERKIVKEELKKKIDEMSDEELDQIAGGKDIPYGTAKELKYVKWACPKCGSKNVINYDPGVWYQMRVACRDCGFYGCRDGEANSITDEQRKTLMGKNKRIDIGPTPPKSGFTVG